MSTWEMERSAIEKAVNNAVKTAAARQRKLFAERLKTLRKNAVLTQAQLAEKTGIHPSIITRYETAKAMPRQKAIEKLAYALNVSVSDLDGSSTSAFDKAAIESCLAKHNIDFTYVENNNIMLESNESLITKELSISELQDIIDTTDKETVKAFKSAMTAYFHKALIHNLFEIDYPLMLSELRKDHPEWADEFETVMGINLKDKQ